MAYPTAATIEMNHDDIPNFGLDPDIMSVQHGDWDDPDTWDLARVPEVTDVVGIDSAHNVTVRTTNCVCKAWGAAGGLLFDHTVNTKLTFQHGIVYGLPLGQTGALVAGTEANPIDADKLCELVVRDTALESLSVDPSQYGNGLIGLGVVKMHGSVKTHCIRLGAEPEATDTALTLSGAVSGWLAGDELLLPDSRQADKVGGQAQGLAGFHWESPLIDSIDGTTINLTAGLNYDHPGGEHNFTVGQQTNPSAFFPHVGNLTRNVIIRSEDGTGVRGHCQFFHRADVDLRYVRVTEMGRTSNAILSSYFEASGAFTNFTNQSPILVNMFGATFVGSRQLKTGDTVTITGVGGNTAANGTWPITVTNANLFEYTLDGSTGNGEWTGGGLVVHQPTNQIGRYAIHFHHCYGPVSTPANGYQFTLEGCVLDDPLPTHHATGQVTLPASKWAIAIHGSSFGRIYRCIFHHYAGGNTAFEDGSETDNEIEECFSASCFGDQNERDKDGRSGSGFYAQGYSHIFRNNISAGNIGQDGGIVSGQGWFFNGPDTPVTHRKPLYKGADVHDGDEGVEYENVITNQQTLIFSGNEAYGMSAVGLTIWENHAPPEDPTIIENFTTWNCYEGEWFGYPTTNMIFDGSIVRSDPNTSDAVKGWTHGDYRGIDVTIRNADVRGTSSGFAESINLVGDILIEDSIFACIVSGLQFQTPATPGTGNTILASHLTIRNCQFPQFGSSPSFKKIRMAYDLSNGKTNLRQTKTVSVEDFDGVPGADFNLYYYEQASDFIMPQTGSSDGKVEFGCPESGLTNAQAYVAYDSDGSAKVGGSLNDPTGCCISGVIAPDDAVDGEEFGVFGLMEMLESEAGPGEGIMVVGSESFTLSSGGW